MLTANMRTHRFMIWHAAVGLLVAGLAFLPVRLFGQPVAYKELLTGSLKGPSGVHVTAEFNRMKSTGVITDPRLLNDILDYKLKQFIWEARVGNLSSLRSMLKADLRAAGSAPKNDVHTKMTADTLRFMTNLVRENYPPVVRFNAILVIGDLNIIEYNSLTKADAVPHPDALAILLTELERPDQTEAVKAGAIFGLKRHIESADAAQRKKIAQIMLNLVRAIEPPANWSADGHRWLRSRAADLLAELGSRNLEADDNHVLLALQAMMMEKDSPWWLRLEAVTALGSLDYTGAQGLPVASIVQQMAELWLEMIEAEAKEVPLSVALQSAVGGGGVMMHGAGGMPGGGMPGGGSYDGGGEAIGGYRGGVPMQFDQYGQPIKPRKERLVMALKAGYVAILTAIHGPGKPDPEEPRGIAAAAVESEHAKQLIDGLETRLRDFKTVLDENFIEWQNRVTQLNLKAFEMKTWLGENTSPSLAIILADVNFNPVPTEEHSLLRQPSPDFTLSDDRGDRVHLADELRKGPVVVVFYYGYWCNHCVAQLFGLHQDISNFQTLGARVIAISADPPEQTAERFAQYGRFAFSVLSDPDHRVAEQFGVWGDAPSQQLHGIFLIGTNGQVLWCRTGQQPFQDNKSLFFLLARDGARAG